MKSKSEKMLDKQKRKNTQTYFFVSFVSFVSFVLVDRHRDEEGFEGRRGKGGHCWSLGCVLGKANRRGSLRYRGSPGEQQSEPLTVSTTQKQSLEGAAAE